MPAVALQVGLEVHVELAARSKMFTRCPSPAHAGAVDAGPNSLIDAVVLALPGTLPVMNRVAVEMAMLVGLALHCRITPRTKWDRKGYFYPDLPKGYQISQYDMPLCADGWLAVPDGDGPARKIGVLRAHLEEDAGKLLHERPGGGSEEDLGFSIVDLNRAGTPLLEVVTQPDFTTAEQVVAFARALRNICRFLGVTEGVMQKGHIRFEPNINCTITLENGRTVTTPIVEVKNLNSFRSLRAAVEHEAAEQPRRWERDGRVHGPGAKRTMGWDDARGITIPQREKEDAHDYRYFPDPDLPPVVVDEHWLESVRSRLPELPQERETRYRAEFDLSPKEAATLVEERDVCLLFDAAVGALVQRHVPRPRAGRLAANMILQSGLKRAGERGVPVSELGITAERIAEVAALRERGLISAAAADELFGLLCVPPGSAGGPAPNQSVESIAGSRGLLLVRDDAALDRWCREAIEAQPQAAADVRAGRSQALGRLVGEAMKRSGGQGDARAVRERLVKILTEPPTEVGGSCS
ncbi:MAG: Asp-tRNA(Asn)/Glu-tRNA(Gln) amidotransferase subunit GatB [Phycisphaerales bacterium]|nr:Asp-tRNA(Asn)/Glu-tRNA(Gln) amidotransferase subunit GatB [Phycisphaerales bacterium]